MNLKKNRERIDSLITKCINAKNSEDFYVYSSKLFFHVTTLIYQLDYDRFHYLDKDCED